MPSRGRHGHPNAGGARDGPRPPLAAEAGAGHRTQRRDGPAGGCAGPYPPPRVRGTASSRRPPAPERGRLVAKAMLLPLAIITDDVASYLPPKAMARLAVLCRDSRRVGPAVDARLLRSPTYRRALHASDRPSPTSCTTAPACRSSVCVTSAAVFSGGARGGRCGGTRTWSRTSCPYHAATHTAAAPLSMVHVAVTSLLV